MNEILFLTTDVRTFMRFRGSFVESIAQNNKVYLAGDGAKEFGSIKVETLDVVLSHNPKKLGKTITGLIKLTVFILKKRKNIELVSTFLIPNLFNLFVSSFLNKKATIFIDGLGFAFTTKAPSRKRLREIFRCAIILFFWAFRNNVKSIITLNPSDYSICHKLFKISKDNIFKIYSVGIFLPNYKFTPNGLGRSKTVRLGFAGRLHFDKGITTLFKAHETLSKHPEFTFSLNIAGEKSSNLSGALVETFSTENIIFDGFVDITEWIADIDIIVLPSFREGSPVVLAEALASGRPVVISNAPGCRNFINQFELVFGFEVGSPDELSRAILQCVDLMLKKNTWMTRAKRDEKKIGNFFDRNKTDESLTHIVLKS